KFNKSIIDTYYSEPFDEERQVLEQVLRERAEQQTKAEEKEKGKSLKDKKN
ncbi:MAG: hypothetical protein HC877_23280, partial [Thioploca sp.]|nr:hypothetical protein [Thioploca sp.]